MKTELPKYAVYFLSWAALMALLLSVCSCTPSYHDQIRNRREAYKKGYVKPRFVDNVKSTSTGLDFPVTK